MKNINRIARMRELLNDALAPTVLEIRDDSHLHRGHSGNTSGAGHFHVRIRAEQLNGLTPIAAHRAIYQALDGMMHTDIHALSIELV